MCILARMARTMDGAQLQLRRQDWKWPEELSNHESITLNYSKGMEASSCAHVGRLKQQGGIRDYEKYLLNFCISCPAHLRKTRDQLKTHRDTAIRCIVPDCSSTAGSWMVYCCLHCVYVSCSEHAIVHAKEMKHPIGSTVLDGTVYCFACKDNIYDPSLEGMRETVQFGRFTLGGGENLTHFTKLTQIIKPIPVFLDPKTTVGLRGLVNLKNTCFVNCIMQVLTHTPLLTDFFLSESDDVDCNRSHQKKPCLMRCMANVFRQSYSGERSPIMMTELMQKIWLSTPHLASTDQQDAHEFLAALLDNLGIHFAWRKHQCSIESIFRGILQSTVKCLICGSESITKEPFMDISLEVFGNTEITLHECLVRYTKIEYLGASHTIDCNQCKMKQESSKQLKFYQTPFILCLHFKRFHNLNESKWEHLISFPTNLNVLGYTSFHESPAEQDEVKTEISPSPSPSKVIKLNPDATKKEKRGNLQEKITPENLTDYHYLLYAVVTHLGSTEGGHYLSYIKNMHNKWFKCDDHQISTVSVEDVLRCQAYMVFYHRNQMPERAFV